MIELKSAFLALLLAAAAPQAAVAADVPPRDQEDPLATLLIGEFSAQEGDYVAAARAYGQAARTYADPALAGYAARLALFSADPELSAQALARWRALDPAAPGVAAGGALLALRRGDAAAAAEALRGLMAGSADGWRWALRTLLAGGDLPAAGDALGRLLASESLPDDLQAWLAFGGLAHRLQRQDLAGDLIARLVGRFPKEPRAWLLQAGQLRRQGDRQAALAAVDRVVGAAAEDIELRLSAASELEQLDQSERAERLLAAGPQTLQSYAARAALLDRRDDDDGLAALYKELSAKSAPDGPMRALLLGQVAERLERTGEAIDWYQRTGSGPARAQAYVRLALLLDGQGKLDEAIDRLRQVQIMEEADDDSARSAYLVEGELRLRHDDPTPALEAYDRGLADFPDDSGLLYARALAHERQDDIAAAEADFRRILAGDPDNVDALNALGYTLADRTGRFQEALELIERAIALQPDNAAIIDSMGWVLYRLGRMDEAAGYLRRAFEAQPDPEIAAHLGEVLWAGGEQTKAREVWARGLGLDAKHRVLQATVQRFAPELSK